jgi:single-strand DNA-binding protein
MLNIVTLVGNVTRDIEVKYTATGTAVANVGMAVNNKYKGKDGEMKKEVCFITLVVWGKRAENCAQQLTKGSPIFVTGRLQSRAWETKDGQKRTTIEVVADLIQFLDRTKEGTSPEQEAPAEAKSTEEEWINSEQ